MNSASKEQGFGLSVGLGLRDECLGLRVKGLVV